MNTFERLVITNWRQFSHVEIRFHNRLTILTGANGAGKTTILHLLNRHWGWDIPYVSTPRYTKRGVKSYWSGFWNLDESDMDAAPVPVDKIGEINYGDRETAILSVPKNVKETFAVEIIPQTHLPGVYVPAHRPLYIHQRVDDIPTNIDAREQIFTVYLNEIRKRWQVNQRVQSPSYMLKRSLMSMATFSYGSETVEPNDEARQTFEGFQRVLSVVLPKSLGFKRLRVRVPDIMFETASGSFAFDAVSGGISALVDMALFRIQVAA